MDYYNRYGKKIQLALPIDIQSFFTLESKPNNYILHLKI